MEDNFGLDPNRLYTCKELAFLWNVDAETIRRKFTAEQGVWRLPGRSGRRHHYRIPGNVAIRVRRRETNF